MCHCVRRVSLLRICLIKLNITHKPCRKNVLLRCAYKNCKYIYVLIFLCISIVAIWKNNSDSCYVVLTNGTFSRPEIIDGRCRSEYNIRSGGTGARQVRGRERAERGKFGSEVYGSCGIPLVDGAGKRENHMNNGLMLGQRLRRWPNIKPLLVPSFKLENITWTVVI